MTASINTLKTNTKICKILNVLQIFVYLFSRNDLCQQVYRSLNLSQFLNIGTNHNNPAIIGNNVYIVPSIYIVENVKIGNNSSIGAGAVVTKDVPKNATVAGVPAKVLNYNNPGRYVNRRWPIQLYLCRWLLDVCYKDAFMHFATLKRQAHASSCKSMNV